MFRHARQLDLARRLNHADRKERILISLRDESRDSSREILLSPRDVASSYFFLSPPPPHLFRLPIVPSTLLRNYYYYYYYYLSANFFFLLPIPRPSRRLRVQIVFSLSLPPTITNNETLSSFPPFSPRIKVATRRNATFPDDSLRTNFSPPFANRITTIVVRHTNYHSSIAVSRRREKDWEEKGKEKSGKIDRSIYRLSSGYIYIPDDGISRG